MYLPKTQWRTSLFQAFMCQERCEKIVKDVIDSNLLRKYFHGPLSNDEPSLQELLAPDVHMDGGYHYHGTNMKPFNISSIPQFEDLSTEMARYFRLEWNIGVHMIMY